MLGFILMGLALVVGFALIVLDIRAERRSMERVRDAIQATIEELKKL